MDTARTVRLCTSYVHAYGTYRNAWNMETRRTVREFDDPLGAWQESGIVGGSLRCRENFLGLRSRKKFSTHVGGVIFHNGEARGVALAEGKC